MFVETVYPVGDKWSSSWSQYLLLIQEGLQVLKTGYYN